MDEIEVSRRVVTALGTTMPDGTIVPPIYDLNNIYKYDLSTNTWRIIDDDTAMAYAQSIIINANQQPGAARTPGSYAAVKGTIKLAKAYLWRRAPRYFQSAPKGFAVSNGFLKLNEQNIVELHDHHPSHGSRFVAPFSFLEQITPRWDAILEAVFAGDADKAAKIELLHEFIGACLLGVAPRFARCLVFLGDGSNGKSTIQSVIHALFPSEIICTSNPQTWHLEYNRAELRGKRINITSELPEREMMESEAFKAIVEGMKILARVIREAPFEYKPEAGHIFAANTLMRTGDLTNGFFRRFLILAFNNVFAPTANDIVTPIITEELSGIAFKAIRAAEAALARGHYTQPDSSREIIEEWKEAANPVAMFIKDCAIPTQSAMEGTRADALWRTWNVWCDETNHQKGTLTSFGRRLTLTLGASKKQKRSDGVYYAVSLNIRGNQLHGLYISARS